MSDRIVILRVMITKGFDSSKISDQKALDDVEEILNKLDEEYGLSYDILERDVYDTL